MATDYELLPLPPVYPVNGTDIVPFTVTWGGGLLGLFEQMRHYIDKTLVPYINTNLTGLSEDWLAQAVALIESVRAIEAAIDVRLESTIDTVDAKIAASELKVTQDLAAALASIGNSVALVDADRVAAEAARTAAQAAAVLAEQYASQAEAIQDTAVSNIFKNAASALRIAMDGVYLSLSRADTFMEMGTAVNLLPLYSTGFESGNPLDLGWTRDPGTSTSWLAATGEDGGYTFVVYTNTVGNEANNRIHRTFTNLVIGQEYTVKYKERIHGTAAGLSAQTGVHIEGVANEASTVANDVWREVTRKFVATATTHKVGVWVVVNAVAGSNGVRVDNFSFAKSGAGTFYAPPGTDGGANNIYNILYTRALGPRWEFGTKADPIADPRPGMWLHKHSKADRPGLVPGEWDHLFYAQIDKKSGAAYSAAITGMVRHENGTGQTIGVHGRSVGYKPDSDVFGVWAYAANGDPAVASKSIIGLESDLNNKAPDQGWGASVGSSRGIVVVGADGSNPNTIGIDVGTQSGSPNGKFWTGMRLRANGMMPAATNSATEVQNGEALLIEGSTQQSMSYNGIRFRGGNLKTGISFAEVAIDNYAAILMKDKQRIVVGDGPAVSTYLELNRDGSGTAHANFNNLPIHVNGTRVVGPRRTGWIKPTGTARLGNFNTETVALNTLAQVVMGLIDAGFAHGFIGETPA